MREGCATATTAADHLYPAPKSGAPFNDGAYVWAEHVLGPAKDGEYFFSGMKSLNSKIFRNKAWGTNSILRDILKNLKNRSLILLEERNDIDVVEDILYYPVLQHCLKTNYD